MSHAPWEIQLIQVSQGKLKNLYIPYGSGLLQAYALTHAAEPARYRFRPYLCERLPLSQNLAAARGADVYGFSCYVWNIEYSLALACRIRQYQPQALIVFGGPQVPDAAEDFLRRHPFIDVCVHGEGEKVFLQLLESLPGRDWSNIPGISWLDAQGECHHQPPGPRLADLDQIPSPYLMGLFGPLLQRQDVHWLVIWETNRGCPFTCSFCDWGSATATRLRRYSLERIQQEIDWFADQGLEVVSVCDANFGLLPRDLEITRHVIAARQRTGFPKVFFIQSAKNVTERTYQIHQQLIQAGISNRVALSMQSLSPPVLKSIRRENISLASYRELQARFSRAGVPTHTDILVGLPGESYDSFVDSICTLLTEGQHDWISFYNVFVLPNAELAQPDYRRQHGLETVNIPYSEIWFALDQEVVEYQEMVIATATLSRQDWCRIRAFAWWVMILHYNFKLLQLPLLVLHKVAGLPWRVILEFFSEGHFCETPMLQDLQRFLGNKAQALQQGEPLHCLLTQDGQAQWIDVENFVVTGLSSPAVAQAFFAEAGQALAQLLHVQGAHLPAGLLQESMRLSEALFLSPIQRQPFVMPGRYNLWEAYQGWLRHLPVQIALSPCRYVRDKLTEPLFDVRVEPLTLAQQVISKPSFGRQGL